jgi:CheY-like chemotaxis protein
MSLEFLAQYQLEIIAGLVVLLLLVLYFLLKKPSKKKEILLEIETPIVDEYELDTDKTKNIPEDIYDIDEEIDEETEIETELETEEETTPKTLKTHTKTLDDIRNIPTDNDRTSEPKYEESNEPRQATHTPTDTSHQFKKQTVPPHAKIKKEDFSKFKGKRILLAEDNIINQKVILGLLGGSGIDVVIANDGQEALDILENDINFMLILMDAHMPNIDGFEATKIIRKNPKYDHIVVVALSGDTASDDIKKMKDAGMSETLEKPLKMDALYDILYAYNTDVTIPNNNESKQASIPILDIQRGLDICSNDKEFYKDILNEFIQDYGTSDESLTIFIKEKKLDEADKLLLDMTGVCANLGAQKMHNIAITAKEMLKTKNINTEALLNSYKEGLTQTLNAINNYIKEK